MWKPGQLVTIKGVVYRVKRSNIIDVCKQCAFNTGVCCTFTEGGKLLLPGNCYLKRVSP